MVKSAEANQPKLVTELRVEDQLRNIILYTSVINIPMKGMIFPMGNKDNWQWEVMKVRPVTEEEKDAHATFIQQLGENAVWNKLETKN